MSWEILNGDCVEQMREMDEASVDAIVTDPPYGLEFMGKEWDQLQAKGRGAKVRERRAAERTPDGQGHSTSKGPYLAAGVDWQGVNQSAMQQWHQTWATEALRVLKPGGHLLAAGGTRTFHRLVSAIEDAGFEIRDCIAHMYGSGFPKSHNGEWGGTALKPGFEPWTLARKPLVGTVEENWREHGTGALNIAGCRIEGEPESPGTTPPTVNGNEQTHGAMVRTDYEAPSGRWPANVVLSHLPECEVVGTRKVRNHGGVPDGESEKASQSAFTSDERTSTVHHFDSDGTETITAWNCAPGCPVAALDEQSGERPSGSRAAGEYGGIGSGPLYGDGGIAELGAIEANSGGASRFFYTAKASRAERNAGLDGFEERQLGGQLGQRDGKRMGRSAEEGAGVRETVGRNAHPT